MKKLKTLCLMALASGALFAFRTKETKEIFRVQTTGTQFTWALSPPENTSCVQDIIKPCSYTIDSADPLPADNTEPTDTSNPSAGNGLYE